MFSFLQKHAHQRNILIAFGLSLFINLGLFPLAESRMASLAPNVMGPLDLRFSYSAEEAFRILDSFGVQGRRLYSMFTIGIDIIYPVVYTFLLMSLLWVLLKKVLPGDEQARWIALLPLIVFVSDLAENCGILLMIRNFPDIPVSLARWTSGFTSVKWTFAAISLVLILALWLKVRMQKMHVRNS